MQSINASGHKYGLVYPGVGWAVWRDNEALPEDLVFDVNYLGGHMPTFALNFSRPGSEVVAQYFMFSASDSRGTGGCMQGAQDVATYLAGIAEIGPYRLITDGSELPVFAFTLKRRGDQLHRVRRLRSAAQHGWLVPAYTFPENRQDLSVLRIVIRAGMKQEMADLLLEDLREQTEFLESLDAPLPQRAQARGVRPQLIPSDSAPRAAPRRPALRRSPRLEHDLEVEDARPESVELARADDRVAGTPACRPEWRSPTRACRRGSAHRSCPRR